MNTNNKTMAGAKETPRQKMIGMMYLVLTALLAMNVSKFVSININADKQTIATNPANAFVNSHFSFGWSQLRNRSGSQPGNRNETRLDMSPISFC